MDELESRFIPLQEVIELESNSKEHDLGSIHSSVERFGFLERIIINKRTGRLIAGHGRTHTITQLKESGEDAPKGIKVENGNWLVPADYVDVDENDEVAASIALNKLVELGGWNEPKLVDNLIAIAGKDGSGLRGTGFDGDELDNLIRMYRPELIENPEDPGAQIDKAAELQEKWQVERGQIWEIGRHRLMCGDSTNAEDVGRLMDGEKADLCLTDPPYGLGFEYGSFEDTEEYVTDIAKDWLPLARKIAKTVVFSCGITRQWLYPVPDWVLCWFYGGGQLRSPWGFNCWQPFLAYGKDPSLSNGKGARPDAVDMNTPANLKDIGHPVPKPLKLWEWLFERLSFNKDDKIYDPFLGSGTTMVSCEMLGRICRGMEIHPPYVAVCLERMSGMGLEPKLLLAP